MSRRNRLRTVAAVIGALAVGAPVAGAGAAITPAFPPFFQAIINPGPTGPMGPLGPHGPLGGNSNLPTGADAWNLGPSGPLGPAGPLGTGAGQPPQP